MADTATLPAAPSHLSSLLDNLTSSLSTCLSAAEPPTSIFSPSSTLATKDGISLLTTKNELLVSYLQNLVFLIILKLRSDPEGGNERDEIGNEVVQKLVELRAYMEKGIKPLEGKLRYQIEKVVRAAEDVERRKVGKTKAKANGIVHQDEDASGTDEDNDHDNEEGDEEQNDLDDLSYRPNPSALQLKAPAQTRSASNPKDNNTSGTYKPPRINPVTMPSTDPLSSTARSRQSRPQKSHLLEDYISTSLSEAPTAEPSIGSSSLSRPSASRKQISQRERKEEVERRRYEEENFIRLPGLSKTERKKRAKTERGRVGGFELGGEDFGGIGEVGDRVSRAVGRKERPQGVLNRSSKRGISDRGGDGDMSGSVRMGEGFEKRRRIVEDRNRRKGRV